MTLGAADLFIKVSLKDFLFSKPEKERREKVSRYLIRSSKTRYLHFLMFLGEILELLLPLVRSGGSLAVTIDHLGSLGRWPLECTGHLKQTFVTRLVIYNGLVLFTCSPSLSFSSASLTVSFSFSTSFCLTLASSDSIAATLILLLFNMAS